MSETAEKFSVAARDPDPSFEHWSTYLKEESRETILEIIHENLAELLDQKDFGSPANLPQTVTNDDMARLLSVLADKDTLSVLDQILEAGIPINIRDKNGVCGLTALQHRSRYPNYSRHHCAMADLLERGADPEIRDREGRSALDHVVTSEVLLTNTGIHYINFLINYGSQDSESVRLAIQILVRHGADLYAQDADGHTAFAKAVLAIKPDAVKAFLDMACAGELDLLGRKVSGDLTAKEFCHGYSEGIAKGDVSGTDELFPISYHTDVAINIRQHEADCEKTRQEIRAQMAAGTYVPPFTDNEPL